MVCDLRWPSPAKYAKRSARNWRKLEGCWWRPRRRPTKNGRSRRHPSIVQGAEPVADFEEAFQEAEDYVHSLVVAGLSAKDGGVVIVGTVRDIIISDEAQALEQYWDDYAAK